VKGERLEVVLSENADAVDESLDHVLERLMLAPELNENLEAVERPLAQPDRLEMVGGLLEKTNREHDRLVSLPGVATPLGRAREIALHERGAIRVDPRGRLHRLRKPRPQRPRPLPVLRLFFVDSGGGKEPRGLHLACRVGQTALSGERATPVDGRHAWELLGTARPKGRVASSEVPEDGERSPGVGATRQEVGKRCEDGDVVFVGDVRFGGRGKQGLLGLFEPPLVHRATGTSA